MFKIVKRFLPKGWAAAISAVGQIAYGVWQVTEGNVEVGLAAISVGVGLLLETYRS